MEQNYLKLNTGKTEVSILGKQPDIWLASWQPDTLGTFPSPRPKPKNLGIWFDHQKLSFDSQITPQAGKCFRILKTLKKILDLLPVNARKAVVSVAYDVTPTSAERGGSPATHSQETRLYGIFTSQATLASYEAEDLVQGSVLLLQSLNKQWPLVLTAFHSTLYSLDESQILARFVFQK